MGGDSVIETLFVRILNRTLLIGCMLLLVGALFVALLAGINFLESGEPAADHSDIAVTYIPLPPVIPTATQTPAEGNATDRISQEDMKLMQAATPGCEALGKFASIITNNRLDFRGAGLTVCEKEQLQTAKRFSGREANYLTNFSSDMQQLASDPHVATNYGSLSDDQAKSAVDTVVNDFAGKFRGAIDAQNTKNQDAQTEALAHRVKSVSLFGAAGITFLAFLFIAFLIVFLRIEKHMEVISLQNTGRKPAS